MTSTSTHCKNCGAPLAGNFCQNCGQSTHIHKITVKHLLHEFFHALTHADKGFLFLMKELITRPGYVAQEYLEGKRKKYFNPLSFLVIAAAIWSLIVLKTGYFESMGSMETRGAYRLPKEISWYFSESMRIILAYGKIIILVITAPLLAFLSWIFFRKQKNTYAENLVLNAFLSGQINLVMVIIFIPAFLLFGHSKMNNNIYQIVFLVYMMIAYHQFFKNHPAFTIIKTILILFLFIVFFWLLIFGFVFIREQFR